MADEELSEWPPAPRYLADGIVQKSSPGDDAVESTYALADVQAWRAHVARLKELRGALRCRHCYAVAPKGPPPRRRNGRCGRCRAARYCSTACQRADYARHKPTCVAVVETGGD